ncbi:site-specific integrase [Chloroflexi bacterium TSY]|nr:site-specific integrase [Chloroflexi bacterium TSY]
MNDNTTSSVQNHTGNSNSQVEALTDIQVPAFSLVVERAEQVILDLFRHKRKNKNTQQAYLRALHRFSGWCEREGLALPELHSQNIETYIEKQLRSEGLSDASIQQHLSALKTIFNRLYIERVLPIDPAAPIRFEGLKKTEGSTPDLSREQIEQLFAEIDKETISGLRNAAMISVMLYSGARVSAVANMKVSDYFGSGDEWYFRLIEKRRKLHIVPAHTEARNYVDRYIETAGIAYQHDTPLFRKFTNTLEITDEPVSQTAITAMIKYYGEKAGIEAKHICSHSCRATAATTLLEQGTPAEEVQRFLNHAHISTTLMYDRRDKKTKKKVVESISYR